MATAFPTKIWRWILFGLEHFAFRVQQKWSVFPIQRINVQRLTADAQASAKVVRPFRSKWTVDTLPHGQKLSFKCRLKLRVPITLKQKASFILPGCWTRSG